MGFAAFTGGQGGITGGDQTATGGNADVRAATGTKNINIGGNPNVQGLFQSPVALIAIAVVAVLLWRRK